MLVGLHPGGRYEIVPFPADREAIDIGDYYSDFSKIASALGWAPNVRLLEGVTRTVEYYDRHRAHYWNAMIQMNAFTAEPADLLREEIESMARVARSGWFILGREVKAFEDAWAQYCGIPFCVGVGNGMDAIEIGLRAMDIGPGDEVITTPMTAIATILAVIRAGATPVLADIDAATALLDPASVERVVTPRTKAWRGEILGFRARLIGAGPIDDRLPQHLELVPLAVVVPLHPSLPGLRGDRFDPCAHRDEASRHQVRPPGETRRGRRTDRDSLEREPAGTQQRRNRSATGDAGPWTGVVVFVAVGSGIGAVVLTTVGQTVHAVGAHRVARDQAGLQRSAEGPREQRPRGRPVFLLLPGPKTGDWR